MPASPEAWLLTVAKRNLLQLARRQRLADDPALRALFPADEAVIDAPPAFPDDRLRLMLVCAHPAIDASIHCALMLQVVLGLDAAHIASAFLVSADAMTKRLTRAKAKICEARTGARLSAAGEFVPLDRQDVQRWDRHLIGLAEQRLAQAAALQQPGPFQLEAAIQSAHCERATTGATPWPGIVRLYKHLLTIAPTVGAHIGHAVATANAQGDAAAGLALLEQMNVTSMNSHQLWWVALAHLRACCGERVAAADAYERALALTHESALQGYLAAELAQLRHS